MKKCFPFLLTVLLLLALTACAETKIISVEQLNTPEMKVGIAQGSAAEAIVRKELPNAELMYFNDNPSGYLAVSQGKADAFQRNASSLSMGDE